MAHVNCSGDNPCIRCLDGIDAREEAQKGHYRGWSERELDIYADARAADEWAARGGVS